MQEKITIDGIDIFIIRKNIKNINITIYPGSKVLLNSPQKKTYEEIFGFANSKISLIKKHIEKVNSKKLELEKQKALRNNLEFSNGEIHYLFGEKYVLDIIQDKKEKVCIGNNKTIEIHTKDPKNKLKKQNLIKEFYREQFCANLIFFVKIAEKKTGLSANDYCIKSMKTRWGTCNVKAKRVWLNLHLAKLSMKYIEYVLIHELLHLVERSHGEKFQSLMTKFLPNWRETKEEMKKIVLKDS